MASVGAVNTNSNSSHYPIAVFALRHHRLADRHPHAPQNRLLTSAALAADPLVLFVAHVVECCIRKDADERGLMTAIHAADAVLLVDPAHAQPTSGDAHTVRRAQSHASDRNSMPQWLASAPSPSPSMPSLQSLPAIHLLW